ncbi:GMC family oxidoreductase N-terminal domain-containing protein [Brenneria sp. g21c3]|uniref:GMC family oxidoreductase n=1 Tax=Brenneria sp. g21c3 TaxID=3093893 RepID=UPI002EA3DD01|nr:GMC family oxidoreductase N-terminal domain-containing protein [Brenneria sp. g21c3]
MIYDYIVVGGGTAGCIMAARLSEDGRHQVLLIEGGRDTPPDRVEEAILDSYPRIAYFNERNLWGKLRVHLHPAAIRGDQPPVRYEQGRLMGGNSSLNDMQANRGTPEDYQEWVDAGAEGWDWDAVLPYYKRLERDMDFKGPLHGDRGPIPIRRIYPDVWPAFSKAAAAAFGAAGYARLQDQNAEFGDGYFPVAISNLYNRRVSTAIGYLDNAARSRPNLHILSHTQALTLILEGTRVVGVRLRQPDGQESSVRGREVVVSCGGIYTPALLLKSGIGPRQVLEAAGIPLVVDAQGVGANVQEHPTISISGILPPDKMLPASLRRHIHVALRYSSGLEQMPASDMYMVAMMKAGWHPVGKRIGALMTWINKVYSRGRITVTSADPYEEPRVELNLLDDRRDIERLKTGFRLIARLFQHPDLQGCVSDLFPTSYSERIRDLGQINFRNKLLTTLLAFALDHSAPLRRLLTRHAMAEGRPLDSLLNDDGLLEAFVREKTHGVWHVSCGARMGAADDPLAVCDPGGRVYGVQGLRLADASVMPTLPRANTALPTMMVAEKIADAALREAATA